MEGLHSYLAPYQQIEVAELQMHTLQVKGDSPLQLTTQIHYSLTGSLGGNRREQRTGEWEFAWRKSSSGRWKISAWSALGEVRTRLTGPGFVDVAAAALQAARLSANKCCTGSIIGELFSTAPAASMSTQTTGSRRATSTATALTTSYICQPAGLPNRLYRNRGDGTFEDATEKGGVGVLDGTSCAIFADLNNNGHQDLIVVLTSGPLLFVNRGDGTFELKPDAFHFARPIRAHSGRRSRGLRSRRIARCLLLHLQLLPGPEAITNTQIPITTHRTVRPTFF